MSYIKGTGLMSFSTTNIARGTRFRSIGSHTPAAIQKTSTIRIIFVHDAATRGSPCCLDLVPLYLRETRLLLAHHDEMTWRPEPFQR
jgi:cytochrome c biogenesis protein CcdA